MDYVPVCQGLIDYTAGYPVCNGVWRSDPLASISMAFDPNSLDPVAVVDAIGSGFIVMGIPLIVIFAARLVIFSIIDKR